MGIRKLTNFPNIYHNIKIKCTGAQVTIVCIYVNYKPITRT